MWINKFKWCLVVGVCLTVVQPTMSEECDGELPGFIFPRTFTGMYDGPTPAFESKSAAIKALGLCVSAEKHAENMINYFSSYGVNVSKIEQDPYARYEEPLFYHVPVHSPSSSSSNPHRILSATFFDYSKYMNTRLNWMEFILISNVDTTGPRGSLKKGELIYYIVFRFKVYGRDFCVQGNSRTPHVAPLTLSLALDMELYNEYWGKGAAIGAAIYNEQRTHETHRYIMTFPAKP